MDTDNRTASAANTTDTNRAPWGPLTMWAFSIGTSIGWGVQDRRYRHRLRHVQI